MSGQEGSSSLSRDMSYRIHRVRENELLRERASWWFQCKPGQWAKQLPLKMSIALADYPRVSVSPYSTIIIIVKVCAKRYSSIVLRKSQFEATTPATAEFAMMRLVEPTWL